VLVKIPLWQLMFKHVYKILLYSAGYLFCSGRGKCSYSHVKLNGSSCIMKCNSLRKLFKKVLPRYELEASDCNSARGHDLHRTLHLMFFSMLWREQDSGKRERNPGIPNFAEWPSLSSLSIGQVENVGFTMTTLPSRGKHHDQWPNHHCLCT
jgi:hypothetical protein